MKNNKGITLTSLVIYIAVVFVVTAGVIRVTTHFSRNMEDAADTSFETEFNKLNLYLLDESKEQGNKIQEITDEVQVEFSNGNKYTYNVTEKMVYLNEGIKICENIEDCEFKQKTAENGKSVLTLTIKIGEITKTVDYVMKSISTQEGGVDIDDYLVGASKVTYYLKAGDYIDYTPTKGTYRVVDGEYGSGYTTTQGYQEFTTEEDNETTTDVDESLKWRVWSIDEQTGEIELVSATAAQSTTPLYLKGADGYNHGVDILNDLCETLYSKTVNGKKVAVGRSINIEDINSKTIYNPKTDTKYGYGNVNKYSEIDATYRKYPNLYVNEEGSYLGGIKKKGSLTGSLGLKDGVLDANGLTTYSTFIGYTDLRIMDDSTTEDVSVTVTQYAYIVGSYLNTKLGINKVSGEMFNLGIMYWVATRSVTDNNPFYFCLRTVSDSGMVSSKLLFSSSGRTNSGW